MGGNLNTELREIFACGTRNPGNLLVESGIPLTLGIQVPLTKNPESDTWNPESKIRDSLTWGEVVTFLISMDSSVDRRGSMELDLNSTLSVLLSLRLVTGSGLGLSGQR